MTITEGFEERRKYATVYILGFEKQPEQPDGWETWTLDSKQGYWKEPSQEFTFTGTKHEIEYVNIVRWYLWGEVHLEISIEIPLFAWEEEGSIYDQVQDLLASFQPHDGTTLVAVEEVLTVLSLRLDERDSGIYGRDEVIRARVELSCQDIFTDLLETPVYIGHGVWQAFANTLTGTESWQVFEPTGAIGAATTNSSSC